MDLRKLKTLIDLVADSTIAELEVTEGDSKVRIVKTVLPWRSRRLASAMRAGASCRSISAVSR